MAPSPPPATSSPTPLTASASAAVAPAREALAAEHDRAGHHEHRIAVGDDSGRPCAHALDRGQVERGGRGVGRRAQRDGGQADAQAGQRAAQGQQHEPERDRARARSGLPASVVVPTCSRCASATSTPTEPNAAALLAHSARPRRSLAHRRGWRCGRSASLGRSAPPSNRSREIRGFGMADSSEKGGVDSRATTVIAWVGPAPYRPRVRRVNR